MIPTGYKSEIPKTHSYPLGAKAISEALAGVPQWDHLKIDFSFFWGFAKDRIPGVPYQVFTVAYSGYREPEWTIWVCPVLRTLKHEIQTKLIAEALPKARKWLESCPNWTNREGGHRLTFFFDELSNELTTEEYSSAEWNTQRI